METSGAKFLQKIISIKDTDYGDFMRKANAYLLELRREEELHPGSKIKNKLIEIQDYLQFRPNWDLESTREQLIHDANELIFLEEIYPEGVPGVPAWTN